MSPRINKILIILINTIIIIISILYSPIVIKFIFNFGLYIGNFLRNLYKFVVF